MTTLDTLIATRGRITLRKNWCQHMLQGRDDAVCLRGAVYVVCDADEEEAALVALAAALPADWVEEYGIGLSAISVFNDHHTHAEVLALLDRAIATERRKLGLTDISALTALLDSRQHEPELEHVD